MAKIHIPVGHGIRPDGTFDPGASHEGETEQNSVDPMAHEAGIWLRARDQDVRDEAYQDDSNYIGSTEDANAWPADVCVPIHRDWVHGPKGVFVLYRSDAGRRLGVEIMQACEDDGFPVRWDWLTRRTDLYILNNTNMPAALVEVGSVGQDEFDEDQERRAVGRSIARGIANYLDIALEDPDMPLNQDDLDAVASVVRSELRDQVLNKDLIASANIGDWVTDQPKTLGWMTRTIRQDLNAAQVLVSSLVSGQTKILTAIADAEGLSVDEVRAVLVQAFEGLTVTFE